MSDQIAGLENARRGNAEEIFLSFAVFTFPALRIDTSFSWFGIFCRLSAFHYEKRMEKCKKTHKKSIWKSTNKTASPI